MTGLVVLPAAVPVVRHLFLATPELTAVVRQRVADVLPPEGSSPRWPAVRITELSTLEVVPRRLGRSLLQIDCLADDQTGADQLGRIVLATLRDAANHRAPGAVMGESTDLAVRAQPDETLTPAIPRSIVTGHVFIRPDP
jgi:hypothetical protein